MGFVTESAIFTNWRMFPQVRPTFIGVALVAGIVDSRLRKVTGNMLGVHAMASSTGHLVFSKRVCKRLFRLIVFCDMAGGADIGLQRHVRYRIDTGVAPVAIAASDFAEFVRTRMPGETHVACVASQTN